jgi:hypothetical protein
MAITINGTGSITGLTAGGLPDGSVTAADLEYAGTSGQVLTSQGSGSAPQWASASSTVTSTATLSGSQYVTFTGIPNAVTTIAVNYTNCSPANTTEQFLRVGTSSGLVTSGYVHMRGYAGGAQGGSYQSDNNSWCPNDWSAAGNHYWGRVVLTNPVNDDWNVTWFFEDDGSNHFGTVHGHIQLSAALDRVAFGFNSGNADAGTVRIEHTI